MNVKYHYKNVLNAVAVELSAEEAAAVAELPDVAAVYPDQIRQIDTDASVDLIGAPAIWNGDTGTGLGTKGEGIIIGVIDTGINHAHPSFADIGEDGYDHDNPNGGYLGVCDPSAPNHIPNFCNDKLIGAYYYHYEATSPEDWNGHGSHTASTAAGNIHEATVSAGNSPVTLTIQGVAPHANIIAYMVCGSDGCYSSDSVKAVDQAIEDGVHVLNYSISGSDDPWNDPVDQAFLDAFNAGIFVSTSAGNDGPGAGTVAKTGGWNASVGNSTINRILANSLDILDPAAPPELIGIGALQGTGPALLDNVEAEIAVDTNNLDGCDTFSEGFFTGKIALIQRGTCNFYVKVLNAEIAGAAAAIIFNNAGGPPIVMGGLEGTSIPSAMIPLESGNALKDYITSNPGATARINFAGTTITDPSWQDIMNQSSSRGPSQFETIKPDYIAPGTNILAAVAAVDGDPDQYDFYSGTSMAAPHGAGSAALLMALHPDWTPAEVKSALASTAYDERILKEDGSTEAGFFDRGSGRLSLADTAYAGLVMDESGANFQQQTLIRAATRKPSTCPVWRTIPASVSVPGPAP